MDANLLKYLSGFITENRLKLFEQALEHRTKYITVVLEDLYQGHNASAVLRSCDCFGIQDVHVVENRNKFSINTEVAMGASKWLTLHSYNQKANNTKQAIAKLRNDGYRIVATSPHISDVNLEDFDLTAGKVALVFGTELTGISDIVKEEADEFVKIPMFGFTESFNISVSVAIILHHLSLVLKQSDAGWQLSSEEKDSLLYEWIKASNKRVDLIEKHYWEKQK